MKIELEEYKDLNASQILRLLREDNGYTQWEVAAGTHLNRGTYTNYELGKRQPDLDTLKTIADFYQVPPAIFFGRSIPAFIQGIKAPILKKIIQGTPMDAQDNIDGYTEIPATLAAMGKHFALKIKEPSMYPYYLKGDTVIVRVQAEAQDSDMVVVTVGSDAAIIRRIQKQAGGITLTAYNQLEYLPRFYSTREITTRPVKIIGVVVESYRKE